MTPPRWNDYYINTDFESFWKDRLSDSERRVCMIIGVGFDPRSLVALEGLARSGNPSQISFVALMLPTSPAVTEYSQRVEQLTQLNRKRLESFTGGTCIYKEEVPIRDEDGHPVGARKSVQVINDLFLQISQHSDVIVDISGLPRSFFFPVIKFLFQKAEANAIRNLHVAVTEDPAIDGKIRGREYGDADYIQHFRPQQQQRLVWLPVISKSEGTRLSKIHSQLESECVEICPIIPFPTKNIRRPDDLLINLREELFERIFVSQENILLCDERTPFDLYRKIVEMDSYYRERLRDLPGIGEITTVVSPLANKMLSLGVLLAAIDRELPVSYVEAGSYDIENEHMELSVEKDDIIPVEIWIAGEPYEE